ncbi:hypothetical protein [Kamptonema formosum]|nr:hypothetical protein [Oscillatoria sp. PCC 10802]
MLTVMIFGGWLLIKAFVFLPLDSLNFLDLPTWLSLSVLLLVFFWLFGE